jgi:hypothetical protein
VTEHVNVVRCPLDPNPSPHRRPSYFREVFDLMPPGSRDTLVQYLRKDQICHSCLTHCELNGTATKHSSNLRIRYGRAVWTGCKWRSWSLGFSDRWCWACDTMHPQLAFSPSQAARVNTPGRVCIGREGYVRLCQHKIVSWAHVEGRIAEWRGGGRGCSGETKKDGSVSGAKVIAADFVCACEAAESPSAGNALERRKDRGQSHNFSHV